MQESQTGRGASEPAAGLGTTGRLALAGFMAVGAYFLWTEHRAHVVQYLPWVLVLLCPLMHLFMHHGHQGGAMRGAQRKDASGGREP